MSTPSTNEVVTRLRALVKQYQKASEWADQSEEGWNVVELVALKTSAQAAIERLAPPGSAYLASYREAIEDGHDAYKLERLIGVVALPAKIAETLTAPAISVEGGEVSGH